VIRRDLAIRNRLGLHARAAARFVHTASRFRSRVTAGRDGRVMDGKSILGILLLAASSGNSTFASRRTRTPSSVRAARPRVPRRRSSSSRYTSRAAPKDSSAAPEGSTTTSPRVPSTATRLPGGICRVASLSPATAGIPRERAMIAVC